MASKFLIKLRKTKNVLTIIFHRKSYILSIIAQRERKRGSCRFPWNVKSKKITSYRLQTLKRTILYSRLQDKYTRWYQMFSPQSLNFETMCTLRWELLIAPLSCRSGDIKQA